MGGMIQPIPVVGKPAGRAMVDIGTLGLAELLPSNIKNPLFDTAGRVFWSPASGLAAGGAGLAGAGGIGGGGMGAASASSPAAGGAGLEGLAQFTGPSVAGQAPTFAPTGASAVLPQGGVAGLSEVGQTGGLASGDALNAPQAARAAAGPSKTDMLQNAFLATSVGGMLGNALQPPPLPPASFPSAPVGGGGSFTPVASGASQQWAQLMAQRRAQQTGKFTG